MRTAIDDLVRMRDIETLVEIMNESEDWMDQMDAAVGLMQLGDQRGLEYLLVARESDIEDVCDTAKEILLDPGNKQLRIQIEADQRYGNQKLVEAARIRLKNGKKVFLYKVIHLPGGAFLHEDDGGAGMQVYELNDAGLEGWEVVNAIPRHQMTGVGSKSAGVYVFLKKELGSEDAAELER
jgi:hypothetical protein